MTKNVRLEQRIVAMKPINHWRLAERQRATLDDVYAGRNEGKYVWRPITDWLPFNSEELARNHFTVHLACQQVPCQRPKRCSCDSVGSFGCASPYCEHTEEGIV